MTLPALIASLKKVEHGFKHILEAGGQLFKDPGLDHLATATALIGGDSYQERMLGVWLLALLSPEQEAALRLLTTKVVADADWRVQEMLAKAIDHYCSCRGYEQSLPQLRRWLKAASPNLNRAVVEGLRIWTSRSYFKMHPQVAIELISALRGKESEYLRKSVGNALRDIRRKHEELVLAEVDTWNLEAPGVRLVYKLVMK